VLANLELLADTLDGERGDAAASALRSSQRMRRLVADLLLLARADVNREIVRRPFDLGRTVVEAAGELGPLAGDHELSVDVEEVIVLGVRDDLQRVAINLMENAIKHTPAGTHVRASVRREGDEAVLTVEDDGPGIPPDQRDRMFDRFVRGGGEVSGSSGLGLAIVRAVAEGHGGSVTVTDAADGRGLRFTVRLPAPAPAPTEAPEPTLVRS
jgi:two-component system OmpR family sensor kinase